MDKNRLIGAVIAVFFTFSIGFFVIRNSVDRGTQAVIDNNILKGSRPQKNATKIDVNRLTKFTSQHYDISSSATLGQTSAVIDAVEKLYATYIQFFEIKNVVPAQDSKFRLRLYRDREEFVRNNRIPWAEAYYRLPICHAYFASDNKNPTHWMIHEATHQLNQELAHIKREKWIDEGLATYFASSQQNNHQLLLGQVDRNTYPIWWLSSLNLRGNIELDIQDGKIIPLSALISGKGGPAMDQNFNLYYLQYWSLTHFLLHAESGRYRKQFISLIQSGASLKEFEDRVGPIAQIQQAWYLDFNAKISEAKKPVNN